MKYVIYNKRDFNVYAKCADLMEVHNEMRRLRADYVGDFGYNYAQIFDDTFTYAPAWPFAFAKWYLVALFVALVFFVAWLVW